jgi:hypothetical protein
LVALQHGESGLQGGGGRDVAERQNPAAVHWLVATSCVGSKDVGEVNVADEIWSGCRVVFCSNREAGVSSGGDELLDLSRGDLRCNGYEVLQRQFDDVGHGFFEGEGAAEQLLLVGFEESFFAGLTDQGGDGVSVGDLAYFARRLHAEQFQYTHRDRGQADDERAKYLHEQQQGRRENHRGAFGSGQGEVLRHHFAEQHVQAGHHRECDDERQRMDEFMRDVKRCQGTGQQ